MTADDQANGIDQKPNSQVIAIIERRSLFRECLARCLGEDLGCAVATFTDFESWREASCDLNASLIVIGVAGASSDDDFRNAIRPVIEQKKGSAVVVLSDARELDRIAACLKAGARGFIPTDGSLSSVIGAIRLVLVGGVFVPADALLSGALPAS